MHIYFIGIGGTGVGPLALIASEAGYSVSGSDQKASEYTRYMQSKGLAVYIDQSGEAIKKVHESYPIDWVVSVSSIVRNNPDHPELVFARENDIRITERDACLNDILEHKNLKMIAAAGTHGKTTTSAMLVWTLQNLGLTISYSVGAKMTFADMGLYAKDSEYFIYECDEFHRNFLHFYPHLSVISGITWDHHEVFPTRDDYKNAFREFIDQSKNTIMWDRDADYIGVQRNETIQIENIANEHISETRLPGIHNRENAWLVIQAAHKITGAPINNIQKIVSDFPGAQRRMEELASGLFTDYAHTPEKIEGCLSVAREIAEQRHKNIVAVYEPLTNRRQHFMKNDYKDVFNSVKHLYWVPTYLSREDPDQAVLAPDELITYLDNPTIAEAAELNDQLWSVLQNEIQNGSIIVCMSGGGGGSLDEWLRTKVREQNQ